MRIAVVHSVYSTQQPSGENSAVADQVEALNYAGHTVLPVYEATDDTENQPAHRLRSAFRVTTGYGRNPAKTIESFGPDLIHVHNTFPNWGTHWMVNSAFPIVSTVHNFRYGCAAGTFFRDGQECFDCAKGKSGSSLLHRCYRGSLAATLPLTISTRPTGNLRRYNRHTQLCIVLNSPAAQKLANYAAIDTDKIRVIPNFSRNADIARPSSSRSGWVYCGRLTAEKGVLELVQAWPDGELLTIIGSGPLEPAIQAISTHKPNVQCLGSVPRDEVGRLLESSLGLIVPSRWAEGLPTVALEAMAVGTPTLISSRCDSSRDLAQKGSAVLLDVGRLEDLPARLAETRRVSRAQVQMSHSAHYSRTAWLKSIERAYLQALRAV